jgi:T4 RnlA family RNA ligase
MNNLPSYERCLEICKNSDGIFYESKFQIGGFNVSVFNYRLATYEDFIKFDALELRGITFVFNRDGSIFRRFLLMEKFFNLNENISTNYESVKDKKVKSVYLKEDGSIISFIQLPDGKIIAKSKTSFESEQSITAQRLLQNQPELYEFVSDCITRNLTPIFEYVGPLNRIVVKYNDSKLILLRLRNNLNGEYQELDNINLPKPEKYQFTLNDLISLKSELEGVEGWIVEFFDGQKVKIKTDWYYSLHRILTDYSNREDYLIDMILNEKIDDVLSVLDNGSESRIFVESIISRTNENVKKMIKEINSLLSEYKGDKKEFSIKYNKHIYFGIAIQCINGKDQMELVKEFILKKTYRLFDARNWLDL